MKQTEPSTPSAWPWLLGLIVGIGVFCGVASVVPGPSCADDTPSAAIGRRGACSHHGGVTSGWTFLGVLPGLFAGIGTVVLIETLKAWGASRREEMVKRLWDQERAKPVRVSAEPVPRRAREDVEAFLRRVMLARGWVAFQYREEDGGGWRECQVFPRWLQTSEVAGESTFCLVGDCSVEGRRVFALSRIDNIRGVEPPPTR